MFRWESHLKNLFSFLIFFVIVSWRWFFTYFHYNTFIGLSSLEFSLNPFMTHIFTVSFCFVLLFTFILLNVSDFLKVWILFCTFIFEFLFAYCWIVCPCKFEAQKNSTFFPKIKFNKQIQQDASESWNSSHKLAPYQVCWPLVLTWPSHWGIMRIYGWKLLVGAPSYHPDKFCDHKYSDNGYIECF